MQKCVTNLRKIRQFIYTICESLKNVSLSEEEELVSFDVTSLYTNVPVLEAIHTCSDLLYNGSHTLPPVDKQTFITLTKIASCNVVMSTQDGFYRQIDGLAMGSPPAPHLANGWMSQFDQTIKDKSKLYARYMDDIICDKNKNSIDETLVRINDLHPSLKFTIEKESNCEIPFLDMKIKNTNGRLSSTWYNKPTDTGLIMNYHALAPKRYKRSVVSGFVYRIHRACSTWKNFHQSLEKAKVILEENQYPPTFVDPIIRKTLEDIQCPNQVNNNSADSSTTQTTKKTLLFVQYRGKCTEAYAQSLRRCNAPCTIVMTLRKLRTVLPSLKPPVEKMIRSGTVYQIQCPCCQACYVGQTSRHLQARFREHINNTGPVKKHIEKCRTSLSPDDVTVLTSTSRGEDYLLTLEALWIKELEPTINTKDEYRGRTLKIML